MHTNLRWTVFLDEFGSDRLFVFVVGWLLIVSFNNHFRLVEPDIVYLNGFQLRSQRA